MELECGSVDGVLVVLEVKLEGHIPKLVMELIGGIMGE
jgi:hypothetical protein